MRTEDAAAGPLRSRRLTGGDVEVEGSGKVDGWRFVVHAADRSLTVVPAPGERVSSSIWKSIPVGAIYRAADELVGAERVDLTASRLPKLRKRPSPEQRDDVIAAAYRQAVLASVSPRAVVARLLDVREDRAGREITRLRNAGLLATVHEERRQAAEEAAR